MHKNILEKVKEKTLLFDGAMGTMVMAAGLSSIKSPMLLNVEKPASIMDIHAAYFSAGADVVITNTFGGNPLKLGVEDLENQMEVINRKGAEIAVEARPEGKFVAGDIGPSGKMLMPLGEISPEEMLENFSLQAEVLIAGGVDLLIIETMFSLQEAVAAVKGAKKISDIPLLASMTFTKTKNGFFTMMGENLSQCSSALADAGADMIGANCTLGSSEMIDLAKELRASTNKPILIQPNAGQPVVRDGVTFYEQTPSDFAMDAKKITDAGADMIGGCCGTTPEFMRMVSETISGN